MLKDKGCSAAEAQQELLQMSEGWQFRSAAQGWGHSTAALCNWTGVSCSADNGLPAQIIMKDLVSGGKEAFVSFIRKMQAMDMLALHL